MEETANSSNKNSSIFVSRNAPVAFIVGVAGFLGSHLAEELISKNIQVIGVDDFSVGLRKNISNLSKDHKFHLVQLSVTDDDFNKRLEALNIPKIDYAFYLPFSETNSEIYTKGVSNFLEFVDSIQRNSKKDKTKICFGSSINLYGNNLTRDEKNLKRGESNFAKLIKDKKLNGRVCRLAFVYGPRMKFNADPFASLIQASLVDRLNEESSQTEFSTRALFIDDAVSLLLKAVFAGATANKIYDGILTPPVKLSEIKQILLDPLWHETRNFKPTLLPPWITPNFKATERGLLWKSKSNIIKSLKETIVYFKEHENIKDLKRSFEQTVVIPEQKNWTFKREDEEEVEDLEKEVNENIWDKGGVVKGRSKKKIFLWGIVTMLILYALVYPFAALALNFYLIDYSLRNSKTALEEGDFNKAMSYTNNSLNYIRRSQSLVESVSILKNVGVVGDGVSNLEDLLNLAETGISGLKDATEGSQNLYLTSKVISGEDNADPTNYYQNSQDKLTQASREIASVKAQLSDPSFVEKYPTFIRPLITQTALKVDGYFNVIDKARTASYIMPEITGVGGKKKTYLVLFLNNLELRSGGGFIGSYGRLTFQNGKLIDIKVDDIYNLDGSLGEVIAPPEPLKTDLNIQRLFLRDTNYEPDFPTNARLAETFYKKEANEDVDGVFSIDLTGSGKLLDAIGGVDLSEYGEHVDGNNLFEKSITHAEVNFFPGSQAKKNYLTSLQNQLFNKVFYLSKQNWPAIIEAVGYSLDSKHLMVYLNDPKLSSYMISENWSGVMPRGVTVSDTTYQDFLSINESNVGANKVNFYLEKSYKLEVIIGKQGEISHRLVANYKNNSPTDVFPAGKYKNRFRVYLPIGAKLTKADFSGQDVLGRFSSFADYERAGYTALLEVAPKEQKTLTLEYQLQKLLQFNNSIASYNLDIVKQAGSQKDPLDISLNYPINMTVNSSSFAAANNQSNSITTDLERDRSISATISIK